MKVKVNFKPGSNVKPSVAARSREVEVNGQTETEVSLSIEPFLTRILMQGKVNGFEMEFQTEVAPSNDVAFVSGRPNVPYTNKYKCFKNNGNGLLFRLVDEDKKMWYFYNDTREYKMIATIEFADRASVETLGKTQVLGAPEDNPEGVILRLEIEPGDTEPFIQGDASNYRLSFSAEPVNNDRPLDSKDIDYENSQPDPEIVSDDAKVYKCFKNNGNGLLFRLVDETQGLWAFYNDTADYLMRATVRFPAGEVYQAGEDAQVLADSEEPGATIVIMDIPPVTTKLFLRGRPANFEVSFAADSLSRSQPERNPHYEGEGPDTSVIDVDEVYKCFKDKENNRDGLFFRLVDKTNNRWAFYNDTADITITARVKFEDDVKVEALGKTVLDKDPDMGLTYLLEVPPGATELFAEGDMGSFQSKFTAVKKVVNQ
ncbi:hypothetical protein STCU_09714 [Strigomonas culicis]|nr:hypothetical protein STCU_09714 [Strigomonas culicis]|eukprot:EPY18906.1 hypothetical protein STCU_09714 [Strigomonas culicis]